MSFYSWRAVCNQCESIHHGYEPKNGCATCGSKDLRIDGTRKERKVKKVSAKKEKPKSKLPELRLEIDRLKLDEEWVHQSEMVFAWGVALADAQKAFDVAKMEYDLSKAEIESAIRTAPADFGVGKVTEAAILAKLPQQPEIQMAQKALVDARHHLEKCRAAVNGLEHRKRALTQLVELWTRDYYSSQTVEMAKSQQPYNDEASKAEVRGKGRRRRKDEAPEVDDDDDDVVTGTVSDEPVTAGAAGGDDDDWF